MDKLIKFSLTGEDVGLFSKHFVQDILPGLPKYKSLNIDDKLEAFKQIYKTHDIDKLKEREVESILEKVFNLFGMSKYKFQAPIGSEKVDFAMFEGESFSEDYSNVYVIADAKAGGRLKNKYYIAKQSNADPIFQIKSYLKEINTQLLNKNQKPVDFAFLTDGMAWRIYCRLFTHNDRDFAGKFIEFNIGAILNEKDIEKQKILFKLFYYFFNAESWKSYLLDVYSKADNLTKEVTEELKKQVYSSLEILATGIWRSIKKDPFDYKTKLEYYGVNIENLSDPKVRRDALNTIYNESVVYLLRLLFLLYVEDRNIFDSKIIKNQGGILDRIRSSDVPIGGITSDNTTLDFDYDMALSRKFLEIDQQYNGGIFSSEKHPLLHKLDIDNFLFANAVDNLCRVYVKDDKEQKPIVVDFGSISVRELGSIYEGLLEYKLTEIDSEVQDVVSIVDKNKKITGVKKGDLQLVNKKGERKSTGSYYTPVEIVDYLVRKTVGIRLEEILLSKFTLKEKVANILAIKICDPSMGSGHFLIKSYEYITRALRQLQETYPDLIGEEDIRATVARKCIYGIDLNPLAVELARMTLWIKTFRVDKPLEFFDVNLKCGNSLLGFHSEIKLDDGNLNLTETVHEMEATIRKTLSDSVEHILNMKSSTVQEINEKQKYYKEHVVRKQKNLTFVLHLNLIKYLFPKKLELVNKYKSELLKYIVNDHDFIFKLYRNNKAGVKEYYSGEEKANEINQILDVVERISSEFKPVHWEVEFPHIFVNGGFDIVLGNPPWDIIKPNHNEVFSDYIDGYAYMETKDAKKLSEDLCSKDSKIDKLYKDYLEYFEIANNFFNDAYEYQIIKGDKGKKLKGDNNLYKVFIEKAYFIMKQDGRCGFVVPSGLNSDQGCSGLRHLLFEKAEMEELIMFLNKRGLFKDVHRQYKFDVILFDKKIPKNEHQIKTGFYWLDPWWLSKEGQRAENYNYKDEKVIHEVFDYPIELAHILSPNTKSLIELRSAKDIPIIKKIARHPLFGDETQEWYARTYNDFHMTNDSNLFNTDGEGYKLMEGKTVHQFDAYFEKPTLFVNSEQGENRLAKKWKQEETKLFNRQYRIAFRAITNATNTRTLICAVLPKFVFAGNSLNLIEVMSYSSYELLSGLTTILNSLVIDYLLRFRVSVNMNAFYVKEIPVIRDTKIIESLGKEALPLTYGKEFKEFRNSEIEYAPEQQEKRDELRASLDAKVAKVYGLTYEELQHVLKNFNGVDIGYKEQVLYAYKSLV